MVPIAEPHTGSTHGMAWGCATLEASQPISCLQLRPDWLSNTGHGSGQSKPSTGQRQVGKSRARTKAPTVAGSGIAEIRGAGGWVE